EWGKLIADVPAATAILDRFLKHAQLIQFKGRSFRLSGRAPRPPQAKTPTQDSAPASPPPPGALADNGELSCPPSN
ncbi:MAG: ATP-binding protein, partial [Verrucomicrobiae bacterium]|nr:ATP-binding protein [Verrucomicrobiae bacterium]